MKIIEEKTDSGELLTLTFRSDESESTADFKQAVRVWLTDNYPDMTWQEIFTRMVILGSDRIILDME